MCLVSVCIPVRNGEEFLHKTIISVLTQGHEHIEVCIADNASSDSTPHIVKQFHDSRLRYHRFEEAVGMAENWNRAAALARGKYVWILSADDVLTADAVKLMLRTAERHGADVVIGRVAVIDGRGLYLGKALDDTRVPGSGPIVEVEKYLLKQGNPVNINHILFCRTLIGAHPFRVASSIAADFDLILRLAQQQRHFVFEQSVVTYYRKHGNNISIDVLALLTVELEVLIHNLEKANEKDLHRRRIVKRRRWIALQSILEQDYRRFNHSSSEEVNPFIRTALQCVYHTPSFVKFVLKCRELINRLLRRGRFP
jgi:glycosyltransferase involved in cell wall biosynthesis